THIDGFGDHCSTFELCPYKIRCGERLSLQTTEKYYSIGGLGLARYFLNLWNRFYVNNRKENAYESIIVCIQKKNGLG
ncbi:MAG: hypothetical protein J1E98_14520, partial [Lachnospiraceae bacterium]|nr:hypothetical protein [Lachnospiraceae bacterium]